MRSSDELEEEQKKEAVNVMEGATGFGGVAQKEVKARPKRSEISA